MENAKIYSLAATLVILIVFYLKRKVLLDLSCTSVFFVSHLIFLCVGVFMSPWLLENDYIRLSYSWCNFNLITELDLIRAICILTVGLVLFLLGHSCLNAIATHNTGRNGTSC
jgi:hypothetical protein